MVETQFQGTARAQTVTSRQNIQANNRLEHAGLASGLATQDGNPGQTDVVVEPDVSELVLSAIKKRERGLTMMLINFLSWWYISSGPSGVLGFEAYIYLSLLLDFTND